MKTSIQLEWITFGIGLLLERVILGIIQAKIFGTHAHRILAEEVIGRPLKKGEVVHHKDGNPINNLIDNLEVLSSQVEHAKLHCKNGRFS